MKTCRWMTRPVAGTVAFVTAVALAGTVLAQEHHDSSARTATVHYSDLDLSSTAGAMALYQRIRGAARVVCEDHGYEVGVDAWREWNGCFHRAVDDAVEKVHSPLLNTLNRRSTPAAPAQVTAMRHR
jgi:UrcA family protein